MVWGDFSPSQQEKHVGVTLSVAERMQSGDTMFCDRPGTREQVETEAEYLSPSKSSPSCDSCWLARHYLLKVLESTWKHPPVPILFG